MPSIHTHTLTRYTNTIGPSEVHAHGPTATVVRSPRGIGPIGAHTTSSPGTTDP